MQRLRNRWLRWIRRRGFGCRSSTRECVRRRWLQSRRRQYGFRRRGSRCAIRPSSMLGCGRSLPFRPTQGLFCVRLIGWWVQVDDLLLADAARLHAGVLDESTAAIGVRAPCQPVEAVVADTLEGIRCGPGFPPREISIVARVTGLQHVSDIRKGKIVRRPHTL